MGFPVDGCNQFSSVVQSCPTLCDPVDCSMPRFPVHHQLPEPTQTHVDHISDAIQPSHPLLSPSPPACNLTQHQSLFQWVGSLHQEAQVLEFQLQHQSFQWISGLISFRIDWFDLLDSRNSQESSPIPQFEGINSLVLYFFYCPTLVSLHDYWKNQCFNYMDLCWQSNVSAF